LTTIIITFKIWQPLGAPIFKHGKRSKIWGKRPLIIKRLATDASYGQQKRRWWMNWH